MRIGNWELQSIRERILRDLYSTIEEDIKKRKIEIVKQAREYYIEPLMPTLTTLPTEMIQEHKDFVVSIKYSSPNTNNEENDVNESWTYSHNIQQFNPVLPGKGTYSYDGAAPQSLDPRLKNVADQLCEEIIAVRKKRKETNDYLVATTNKFTGSLQLRKEWPSSLHKYLPPEPIKVAKSAKGTQKVAVNNITLPDHVHETMTNNLLEGD